jgi:hypothetical protein
MESQRPSLVFISHIKRNTLITNNLSNIGDAQGWSAAAVRECTLQQAHLAFRVNSRACPSGRVRPIYKSIERFQARDSFCEIYDEGFYSVKVGHRIRPNAESEYGSSLPKTAISARSPISGLKRKGCVCVCALLVR